MNCDNFFFCVVWDLAIPTCKSLADGDSFGLRVLFPFPGSSPRRQLWFASQVSTGVDTGQPFSQPFPAAEWCPEFPSLRCETLDCE